MAAVTSLANPPLAARGFCSIEDQEGAAQDTTIWGEGASVGPVTASSEFGIVAYGERQKTLDHPRIFVYELESKKVVSSWECEDELGVLALALCRDHPWIAALGDIPYHTIMVFDWQQRTLVASASARASRAVELSFNPLNRLALASTGSKLELWQLQIAEEEGDENLLHAEPVASLEQEEHELTAHCWAPGNTLVVGADSGEILHVNCRTGKRVVGSSWLQVCDGPVGALAVSLRHVVVGGSDGRVVWVVLNGHSVERRTPWLDGPVCALSFSPSFSHLLFGTTSGAVFHCPVPAGLLTQAPDVESGDGVLDSGVQFAGGSTDSTVAALAAFSTLPIAITGGRRGVLGVWKLPLLERVADIPLCPDGVGISSVALWEEGRAAAVGTTAGAVVLVDLSDLGDPRKVFEQTLHAGAVTCLSFLPPLVASVGAEGTVGITAVSELGGYAAGLLGVPRALQVVQMAGVMVVSTADKEVVGYKLPTSEAVAEAVAKAAGRGRMAIEVEELLAQRTHRKIPSSIAVMVAVDVGQPDSGRLFAWCRDYSLRSFTFKASPFQISQISAAPNFPTPGSAVAVASDAETVAAGFRDGTVIFRTLSDLEAAGPSRILHDGSKGGVGGLSLGTGSLKGWLLTGGKDGSLMSVAYKPDVVAPRELPPPAVQGLFSEVEAVGEGGGEEGEGSGGEGGGGGEMGVRRAGSMKGQAAAMQTTLAGLKGRFDALLERNRSVGEDERLDRGDLVVDVAERDRMVEEGERRVQLVRSEIWHENLRKDKQAELIRQACLDTMEVKQLTVVPLKGSAAQVSNFVLPKISEAEELAVERVKLLRRMEIRELSTHKEQGLEAPTDGLLMSMQEYRGQGGNGGGDDGGAERGEGEEEAEAQGEEKLLYSHLDLTCRERRLNQVVLLRDKVRRLKVDFNRRVDEAVKAKSNEIDRIEEKNGRLAEILEELQTQEDLERFALAPSEVEGAELQVQDHEVTVERYLSAAERLEQEKLRAEEEARKAASAKDDQVARALNDMMYGTLETKKEAAGVEELERPAFADQPPETLSDEQVKAIKEYEKKLKALQEEQEKLRRALETEAKKVRGEIQAIVEAFDVTLLQLADARLDVQKQVYELELAMTLLLDTVVREHDATDIISNLVQLVDSAEVEMNGATAAVEALRTELEAFREAYEMLLNEDKAMDKAARKDTAESPFQEQLLKAFKARWRQHAASPGEESRGSARQKTSKAISLDPMEIEEEEEEEDAGISGSIEIGVDVPEGVDVELVERLSALRVEKLRSEAEIRRKANQLLLLNQRMGELVAIQAEAMGQHEWAVEELARVQEGSKMGAFDLQMLLTVKQGQVEREDAGGQSDEMGDAAMIEVAVVHRLNEVVKKLGQEKVGIMSELKGSRRKIHGNNWENEMLDFKAEEVAENTRYFQLLWVTKELQTIIKGGDDDRKAAENLTLEKQIEHSKQLHDLKVEDMKRRLFKAHKQIREKELENNKLSDYVQDLAVSVAQREKIMRVRESDPDAIDETEYKMQEVVWRRLVIEEARQQTEDIAILKAEVDRLRQRTFPSFAKTFANQNNLNR